MNTFNILSIFKQVNSVIVSIASRMSFNKTENRRIADLPGRTQNTHSSPFQWALSWIGMPGSCFGKSHFPLIKKDLGSYRLVSLVSVPEKKMQKIFLSIIFGQMKETKVMRLLIQ